jgi:hypothetical protein
MDETSDITKANISDGMKMTTNNLPDSGDQWWSGGWGNKTKDSSFFDTTGKTLQSDVEVGRRVPLEQVPTAKDAGAGSATSSVSNADN